MVLLPAVVIRTPCGVACPRTAHTALHEELATRVPRLDGHVVVMLAHADVQLVEPNS